MNSISQDTATTIFDIQAIDVGYYQTKFTLASRQAVPASQVKVDRFPSIAPRLGATELILETNQVGLDGVVVHVNGVAYVVGKDVKHQCKGSEPRDVLDDFAASDRYLALVEGAFSYMLENAGVSGDVCIQNLMLGLPINTYQKHSQTLKARIVGDHFISQRFSDSRQRVTVNNVHVIVQPRGALTNFGISGGMSRPSDAMCLVVDVGGGTVDWFLTYGTRPHWARSGAYPKGTLACAAAVSDSINPTWRDNFSLMEKIGTALREEAQSFTAGGENYVLADFNSAVEAVYQEVADKILFSLGTIDDLDCILFTGGGGRMFGKFFVNKYPKVKRICSIDEDALYGNLRGFFAIGQFVCPASGV